MRAHRSLRVVGALATVAALVVLFPGSPLRGAVEDALPMAAPEEVGMSSERLQRVSALMQRNDQLRADAQVEATRRAELAASLDRAAPVLLTGPMITQSLTPADRLPRPLSGATWDGPPRDGRGPEPEP